MTYLEEVYADLLAADQQRPRSKQVAIGGSQLFGCRAENVLRLNGVPPSDPRLSWEAFVGSAIDHRFGQTRKRMHPDLLIQERVQYRGVWFSCDEYDPCTNTITDMKSKNSAADCAKAVKWMEQGLYDAPAKRAQLHGGAAALIEAGHEVDMIQLVFLPRAGGWEGARTFSEPFDRTWADRGVEWAAEVMRLAEGPGFAPDIPRFEELRDKDPKFCWAYCPFVSTCRGPW